MQSITLIQEYIDSLRLVLKEFPSVLMTKIKNDGTTTSTQVLATLSFNSYKITPDAVNARSFSDNITNKYRSIAVSAMYVLSQIDLSEYDVERALVVLLNCVYLRPYISGVLVKMDGISQGDSIFSDTEAVSNLITVLDSTRDMPIDAPLEDLLSVCYEKLRALAINSTAPSSNTLH